MPLPAVNRRLAQAIVKTVPAPDLSLRGGRRPTWRPEREARGSALGVQSREGSCSSYKLSLKWCAPIASVAALTAQPLAALPPYGCGVPFTGGERLAGQQHVLHCFCGAVPTGLSLRGPKGAVAISGRQLRFRREYPVIQPSTARLPRRLRLLAMTRQGNTAVHQRLSAVELPRTGRSVSALQAGNIQGMYFMA